MDEAETEFANGLLTGTVNGRAFQPFDMDADPKTAVFVDGKPAPGGSLPGKGMKKQLERLEAEINDVIQDCEIVTTLDETVAPQAVIAFARAGNDTGHHSDTYGDFECNFCKGGVVAAATVTCGVTCFFTAGIACPSCIAGAALAVPLGILACEQSNACCPKACGGGFPGTCCFGDETCLDTVDGLCCSPGTQPCAGEACCRSDESCIDQGSQKGDCCKDDKLCGALNCCEDTKTCFDAGAGTCCGPGLECGDVCCGRATDTLSFCLDPSTSTCCDSTRAVCNGICCAAGQTCSAGGDCITPEETCEQPCMSNADCEASNFIRCSDAGCCVNTPL